MKLLFRERVAKQNINRCMLHIRSPDQSVLRRNISSQTQEQSELLVTLVHWCDGGRLCGQLWWSSAGQLHRQWSRTRRTQQQQPTTDSSCRLRVSWRHKLCSDGRSSIYLSTRHTAPLTITALRPALCGHRPRRGVRFELRRLTNGALLRCVSV